MRMKMKKIVFALFSVVSLTLMLSLTSMKDDDKPISFAQLPKVAQQFVKANFTSKVSLVTLDNDLIGKSYEVILENATRIEFDGKGNWKEVDAEHGVVPKKIVPNAISSYVAKNFSGTSIKQIEKRRRGGYQVELSNGLELTFDSNLKFVRIDD